MSSKDARPSPPASDSSQAGFAHVGRYSSWSFLALDVLGALLWYGALLKYGTHGRAIKIGGTMGLVGVLADAGYWYGIRKTRKVEIRTGEDRWTEVARWDPAYIGVWLMLWVDLAIGTNIGTWIGLMFEHELDVFNPWTAGFLLWFLLVAAIAKLLRLPGDVRIRATRLMSTRMRLTSLILPATVYVILWYLDRVTWGQIGGMILIGLLASFAMEFPLYTLGWRHPPGHWAAPVANTICEWNSVVPLLYVLYLSLS